MTLKGVGNLREFRKGVVSVAATLGFVSIAGAANVPASYSIYSLDELNIMDRAQISGGTIGTNSTTKIGYEVVIDGHVFSVGNVSIKDNTAVHGTVKTNGIVQPGRNVSMGDVIQRAQLPTYTIQTKTVTPGTSTVNVGNDQTRILTPGNYGNVTVYDRATLQLNAGVYNFNSLVFGNNCTIKLNYESGQTVQINVKTNFKIQDRDNFVFLISNNPEAVTIYSNQTSELVLGYDANVQANLVAPYAHVKVMDRAKVAGQLLAKRVTFSYDASTDGSINALQYDSDSDGVSDYAENLIGTNPNNAGSKPAVPGNGTYVNKTQNSAQSLSLNVSHINGYSQTNVPFVYSKGDIRGNMVPVLNIVPKTSSGAPTKPIPGVGGTFRSDGVGQTMYYDIEGEVVSGRKVYFAFPLSNDACGMPKEFIRLHHFNKTTNDWEDVEIDKVVGNIAYAWVSSFSFYAADFFQHIMKVDATYTNLPDANDPYKFNTIEDAFTAILDHDNYYNNPDLTNKELAYSFGVFVRGGTAITYPENVNLSLPIKTSIIGGFANLDDDRTNWTYADPTANPVVITPLGSASGSLMTVDDPGSLIASEVYIDGLTFKNAHGTNDEAALFLSSGNHYTHVNVKNCVFTENSGERAAGIYLFNVSNVIIEGCVFDRNTTASTQYGGSAITAYHVAICGVGVDVRSCVFYGNKHQNATTSGGWGSTICVTNSSGTYLNYRYVSIYNNTFYKNRSEFGPGCIVAFFPHTPTDFTDHLYIRNNIMYDNQSYGTALNVLPASYDDGSNYLSNPKFTGSLVASPFTAVGDFSKIGTDDLTVAKGADGKWGTIDDGMGLDKSSGCINTGIYTVVPVDHGNASAGNHLLVCERDAAYRLRNGTTVSSTGLTSTTYKQDKGAYEFYLKVMCVGDNNSAGGQKNEANYQSYLKEYADAAGFPIDYVGPLSSPTGVTTIDAGAIALLGGDPSVPQSEKQTSDLQGACVRDATLSTFSATAFFTQIYNTKSDVTLVMIGDKDNGAIPAQTVIDFAKTLINNNIVIASNIVLDLSGNNENFIRDFNQSNNFGSVVKGGNPNTISLDGETYISDYMSGGSSDNEVTSDGFKILANNFWASLGPVLPVAPVAPTAITSTPAVSTVIDTDASGSESVTITGTAVSGCTYQWIVDGTISSTTTSSATISLDVAARPHLVQFVITNTASGLRSIYNMSITVATN